eukprot:2356770-Prymnesium_polylepis.1
MQQGHVRHDILVDKQRIGRIIGPRGATLQQLTHSTQCEIFVMDKEGAPIGYSPDQRVVILVGGPGQVMYAASEIDNLLANGTLSAAVSGAGPFVGPVAGPGAGGPGAGNGAMGCGMCGPMPQMPELGYSAEYTPSADTSAAAGGVGYNFTAFLGDWPITQKRVGSRIQTLMNTPGNVRNDMIVEKAKVGRIIGPQGSTLK